LSLFGLPELTGIILFHLSKCDQLQWALVSKKWHYAVIPHIWRDLSIFTSDQYMRLARMILNDYLVVTDGYQQSALAKYCPLIRNLDSLYVFVREQQYSYKAAFDDLLPRPLLDCTHLNTLEWAQSSIIVHSSIGWPGARSHWKRSSLMSMYMPARITFRRSMSTTQNKNRFQTYDF
jgi:hypothetical protein